MKLNTNFNQFKKNYFNKKNQIVFNKIKCKDLSIFENIINNLLIFPDSFIFESVEGGKTRGRYTFVGIEPDKIWNFLKNNGINVKTKMLKNCEHKIPVEGSSLGLRFLKKNLFY